MQFLVDTLSFRVVSMGRKEILDFLGLLELDIPWQRGNGFNGYLSSIYYNGIKIGFGGMQGFNVYVHMSGVGCRTFEDLRPGLDWWSFVTALRSDPMEIHIARVDIACDETDGFLNFDRLQRYYKAGKYSTRCRFIDIIYGSEEIMYVGSPQSDVRLRIYNKKLERGYTEPEDLDGNPWYRAEFQLRDESAAAFLDKWIHCENLGTVFSGLLREHIRFLKKRNDKISANKIKEASWWVEFCQNAERVKLARAVGSDYNKHKLYDFCFRTSGSSIRTLIESEQLTPDELWKMFAHDGIKLRSDQQAYIDRCRNDRQ